MRTEFGNLFEVDSDAICITTNGFVKNDGRAVMGRGCAWQALQIWPEIDRVLGNAISANGNVVQRLGIQDGKDIIAFPVKPISSIVLPDRSNVVTHMRDRYKPGDFLPGFAAVADIATIVKSARELQHYVNENGRSNVKLPKPGCGAGELDWRAVKPLIANLLDDRITVIDFI